MVMIPRDYHTLYLSLCSWAVNPAELREALDVAGDFKMSDMHDAAEVLVHLFAGLRR